MSKGERNILIISLLMAVIVGSVFAYQTYLENTTISETYTLKVEYINGHIVYYDDVLYNHDSKNCSELVVMRILDGENKQIFLPKYNIVNYEILD